jgi:RHS repeat-associated protein
MSVTDFVEDNPESTSAYIYNAGFDRAWKLSGNVEQMTLNGTQVVNIANLNTKTLYASPYMVATDNNYTKHYFAGSERVSSKIGGGFIGEDPLSPTGGIVSFISGDEATHAEALEGQIFSNLECSIGELFEVVMTPIFGGIEDYTTIDEPEDQQYYLHTDHLGSSSFITDQSGEAVQHLQYMAFGESFVNQTSTSWETRFTFSGKEKDSETGYSYFGARYYDSDLSVWLSVDLLSDMYTSTSPFMYVRGNPIILVDPTGMSDKKFGNKPPKKRWWKFWKKGKEKDGNQRGRKSRWVMVRS